MTRRLLTRALGLQAHEARPVLGGFALFFLLFCGYFMLRPVRETMGITGGVDNLHWLFTATFVATVAAMPLFGWIASRVARRRILYWVYGFFAANLVLFALGLLHAPDDVWLARGFYVWLSVFNMIAISLAWSVLVDLFSTGEAKRLFPAVAAGASGVFIEIHPRPDSALCDGPNSLALEKVKPLLSLLKEIHSLVKGAG